MSRRMSETRFRELLRLARSFARGSSETGRRAALAGLRSMLAFFSAAARRRR